jgi:drug/metabolite transporter (DMT)-like permease
MNQAKTGYSPSPYLLLTLTVLFWSGNFVIARAAHAAIPPLTLSFWRWTLAFIVIAPFAVAHARRDWRLMLGQWRRVLALAVFGITGFNSLVYMGLQYTGATNALLLNAFIPILTMLITWGFMGRHLGKRQLLGVALSFSGVVVILARGDWQRLEALDFNRGDLLVALAAVVWALYTVLLKGLDPRINRIGFLAVITFIGTLGIAPFYLWELSRVGGVELTGGNLLSFAYVGLFPSVLAYIFYNRGVAEVGPERASLFIHLMPVFGTIMSIAFLGEVFALFHLIGIAAIFGGIFLSTHKPSSQP